jgi:prepilin peptidase CpaA
MGYLSFDSATTIAIGALVMLLVRAAWADIKSHRISNELVFFGAGLGLFLNSALPEGFGFVSMLPGALGFWKSLGGLGLGLVILLPLYMLRVMGAGDVKLIAMVGAFLGPNAIIGVILMTFIVGGFLSLLIVLRHKTLGRLASNLRSMMTTVYLKIILHEMPIVEAAPISAGKSPYGVAIAGGTFVYIALAKTGNTDFLHSLLIF